MANLEQTMNLLAFSNAAVVTLQGKLQTKRGVFIPIEDNDIFVSKDNNTGKAKAAYLHFTAWERREVGQYGDTHNLRQNFSKEYKELVGEEVIKAKPYLGNGKVSEWKPENHANDVNAPCVTFDDNADDLPF